MTDDEYIRKHAAALSDGGPAFPGQWMNNSSELDFSPDRQSVPPGRTVHMQGMSLRDYFAAAALQGYLAALASDARGSSHLAVPENTAENCYRYADAMLRERDE